MPAHSSDSQGQPRGKRPVRRVGHEVYQLILFQKQVCGTVCSFNWHTFQKDLHTGCRNTANKVTAYIAKATKITNTVEMMTSWLEKILSLDMNHSTGKKTWYLYYCRTIDWPNPPVQLYSRGYLFGRLVVFALLTFLCYSGL